MTLMVQGLFTQNVRIASPSAVIPHYVRILNPLSQSQAVAEQREAWLGEWRLDRQPPA